MEKRKNWTRDELIIALNLYLKLPFGKLHAGNPDIIHLAHILDRTPSSIAMRLSNFASVDPFHQNRGVSGLKGGKKQVEPIWNEFLNNKEELLFESERILAEKENTSIEEKFSGSLEEISPIEGKEKFRLIKTRVNQHVFRQIVLSNYSGKCALTGIDIPDLLVASHIIPWAKSEKERLNPENGICLSSLYDKAYDKGYIGINQNLEIVLSKTLKNNLEKNYYNQHFRTLENSKVTIPKKYPPKKSFLEYHMDVVFKG